MDEKRNGENQPEEQQTEGETETPRLYRLTHTQWNHAVWDLLELDGTVYSEDFIGDTLGAGFENDTETLVVSPLLFQDYQRAAEGLVHTVIGEPSVYLRIVPEDLRPDVMDMAFSERLEGEEGEASVGAANETSYNLWSEGVLTMNVTLPFSGLYQVTPVMEGTDCGDDVGAQFMLSVGDVVILEDFALGSYEETVDIELVAGDYEIGISFRNDCYDPDQGYDRNLFIDYVDIEGGMDLGSSGSDLASLRGWVDRITAQAYRRGLSSEEKEQWYNIFDQGASIIQSGDDFVDGVQLVLLALLQSPHFVYRIENTSSLEPLSAEELAAKLSFQLCDAPPDHQMRADLSAGVFLENYEEHVVRLLHAPCGEEKLLQFHHSLLHTEGYANMFKTNEVWDEELNTDMKQEVDAFVRELLMVENGSVFDLYTADFTMANFRIASLYGLDISSSDFVRIELDPAERSGLLTLSGVLAYQSDAAQSNPIHRGVFLNTELLCVDLPAPPDVVEPLPVQEEGQTNRERIDLHTGVGTCGESCHAGLINPPGFAFEHYDELGRYRTMESDTTVDASGSYYFDEESSFVDGVSFSLALATSKKAHTCYTRKLSQYVLGRQLQNAEETLVSTLAEHSLEGESILSLVHRLVHDPVFMMRGE